MKYLVVLLVLAITGCGLHTQAVSPRQPDYINPPEAPVTITVQPSPTPNYYRVYTDSNSNVICVDTDVPLNFFGC